MRSLNNIQGEYYISPKFLEAVAVRRIVAEASS